MEGAGRRGHRGKPTAKKHTAKPAPVAAPAAATAALKYIKGAVSNLSARAAALAKEVKAVAKSAPAALKNNFDPYSVGNRKGNLFTKRIAAAVQAVPKPKNAKVHPMQSRRGQSSSLDRMERGI